MPPVGFEPTISEGERQHTYALDRATAGISNISIIADEYHRNTTVYLCRNERTNV